MAKIVPETVILPFSRDKWENTLLLAIRNLYLILARAHNTHVTASDPAFTTLYPLNSVIIAAGTSAIAVRYFKIRSGKKLVIESGAIMRIL